MCAWAAGWVGGAGLRVVLAYDGVMVISFFLSFPTLPSYHLASSPTQPPIHPSTHAQPTQVAALFERNRLPLWNLYRHYCSPKGGGVGRQHMSLTFVQAWSLACDFNICPRPGGGGGGGGGGGSVAKTICTCHGFSEMFDGAVLLDANKATKKKSHKPVHNIDFEGFIRLIATIACRHVNQADQEGDAGEDGEPGSGTVAPSERRIAALLAHMQRSQATLTTNGGVGRPGIRNCSAARTGTLASSVVRSTTSTYSYSEPGARSPGVSIRGGAMARRSSEQPREAGAMSPPGVVFKL